MPELQTLAPERLAILHAFALKHKCIFEDEGSVGFGRPCVGFIKGTGYINFNPQSQGQEYKPIEGLQDSRWRNLAPADAYHKHDCLSVLVRSTKEEALEQLAGWVAAIEAIGGEIVQYETGAEYHSLCNGLFGYAFRLTPQASSPQEPSTSRRPSESEAAEAPASTPPLDHSTKP